MIKRDELANEFSYLHKAKFDEMLFILLGRDEAATVAIEAWIKERIRLGRNEPDDEKIIEAKQCIVKMAAQRSTIRDLAV